MKTCRRWALLLTVTCALSARAEMRLLAAASTDSYRSLSFGLSAFAQAAGLPFTLDDINTQAAQLLFMPTLAGVDPQSPLWLLWLMSDQTNHLERGIATVAVLPTLDHAVLALQNLNDTYPTRARDAERQLWRFSRPATTNASAATVYAAAVGDNLIIAANADAASWVCRHPPAAETDAALTTAGQLRVEIQPATLAALLRAYREQRQNQTRDIVNDSAERLLADVRRLSLFIEATTASLGARLTLTAAPETPLAHGCAMLRAPPAELWRLPPDDASFAAVSGGCSLLEMLAPYLAANAVSNAPSLNAAAMRQIPGLTGDNATFIGRVAATGAIYYASVFAATNSRVAWQTACARPRDFLPLAPSFGLATNGVREISGAATLDLVFTENRVGGDAARNAADMAAFMLRDGGLSLAATSNLLIVAFGPSNAVEYVIQRLASSAARRPPLSARCQRLLPEMDATACAAMLAQPVLLMRQIAASLPNMDAERLALLPEPGDGVAVAIARMSPTEARLTLRVAANEVARAQKALLEGRAALQEMFMQMAVQQLMQRREGPGDPRHQREGGEAPANKPPPDGATK